MSVQTPNIAQWLRRKYDANMIELVLCVDNGGERREIENFETATEEPDESYFEQLSEDLTARATAEQKTSRTKLKFSLIATLGNDKKASLPFTLPKDGSIFKRSAPQDSFSGQVYRHNEFFVTAILNERKGIASSYDRQLSSLEKQIDAQNKIIIEQQLSIRELTKQRDEAESNRHERQLELIEREAKIERIDKISENFMLVLPSIVNKFVGRNVLPEPVSVKQIAIKQFLSSLTPEQKVTFWGALSPEQQVAFGTLIEEEEESTETESETETDGSPN